MAARTSEPPLKSAAAQPAKAKFPPVFLAWCVLKTAFQQSISLCSILFIIQSGFFNPFGYDATVWSRDTLVWLCLPQAVFEIIDLFFETWITLRVQTSGDHLPWDSIVHHFCTAGYYLYVFAKGDSLSHQFLGLPVAGLSCQIIGVLYTIHRLRYRFRLIGFLLLTVQSMYRLPLALVSLVRAAQFYAEAPLAHFVICLVLANLDFRWTTWAFKLNNRLQKQHRARLEEQAAAQAAALLQYETLDKSQRTRLEAVDKSLAKEVAKEEPPIPGLSSDALEASLGLPAVMSYKTL